MMKKLDVVVDAESDNLNPFAKNIWVVVVKIVGMPEDDEASFRVCRTREALLKIINSGALNKVIFHNGLGFDLDLFQRVWDIPYTVGADGNDTWNGQPVRFVDTLHLSQFLNPDRPGGHSVDAWSERLNGTSRKVQHDDWSQFSPEMLNRCRMDTMDQEKIYHALMKEVESRQTEEAQ
jgi:hypothetical protein